MKNQDSPAWVAGAPTRSQPGDASAPRQPGNSEGTQRPRRPRAPQFGSDRRSQRDRDGTRPGSARPAAGVERHGAFDDNAGSNADDNRGNRERRKATQDRRQSWHDISKEALR